LFEKLFSSTQSEIVRLETLLNQKMTLLLMDISVYFVFVYHDLFPVIHTVMSYENESQTISFLYLRIPTLKLFSHDVPDGLGWRRRSDQSNCSN